VGLGKKKMKMRHKLKLLRMTVGGISPYIFIIGFGFMVVIQKYELSIFGLSPNWTSGLCIFVTTILMFGYQFTIGDKFILWCFKVEEENKDGSFPNKKG